MYPLQLLTADMPLVALMGMTTMAQLEAMEGLTAPPNVTPQLADVGRELPLTASSCTVPRMLTPPSRTQWQCPSSNQEAAASRTEEE